jgi:hypothetical protein
LKEGSFVPNYVCKVMKGRPEKGLIQKIKNSNLMTYGEPLLSHIIEQEFINTFQNIFSSILLNKSSSTCFKIYSLVYY